MHLEMLREHGGAHGIRDEGLLASALARPQHVFAYREDASVHELAAAYAFGIARNHPFVDGNKRTAFTTAAVFLRLNGYRLSATETEAADTFLALAAGALEEEALAEWFRGHTTAAPPPDAG